MKSPIKWRWGIASALAMALLAIAPQLHLWCERGEAWQGSFVSFYTDETAYAAYLKALIEGRTRRNDPYTGLNDTPQEPLRESLFSIQFVAPYLLAVPARLLGLRTSTVFIVLSPIAAFTTALALFWLIQLLVHNEQVSAALVLTTFNRSRKFSA
jgi:hypothetical protein